MALRVKVVSPTTINTTVVDPAVINTSVKGTSFDSFLINETDTVGGMFYLREATINGTDRLILKAPDALAGDVTYTFPATIVANQFLTTDANGNLSFSALPEGTFTIAGNTGTDLFTNGQTLSFLGSTNQITTTVTNNTVTFSLSNNITISNNLTLGGTLIINGSPIGVNYGGTGVNTFTVNGIVYGNGTSPLQVTAAGTQGKILQAGVDGVPVFDDLDGGAY